MVKINTMRKDDSEFTETKHINNSDLMLNYKGALIYSFLLLELLLCITTLMYIQYYRYIHCSLVLGI